jgi:hypothetical protein
MTIDNAKDKPDLPHTDDINLILQNFVEYYAGLYKYKEICPSANKLIGNLTLQLEEEKEKALSIPISPKEMLRALVDTPNGKAPGTDRLPYKCYKALPNKAANILAAIGNRMSDKGTQPA